MPRMYSPAALALEHARGAGEEADLVDHRRDLLAAVSAIGLPVFSLSSCDELVGRASTRRRSQQRALRSLGVVSRHSSKAAAAAA